MPTNSPFDLSAQICWPTSFYHRQWQDHQQEAAGIMELLYQLRGQPAAPIDSAVAVRAKSGYGIYESGFDLFTHQHAGLSKLMGFIGQSLAAAVSHADGGRIEASQLDLAIVESWFHISNHGGYHDAHFHHNCSWCGIYYLQTGTSGPPANGGAPNGGSRFYSPLSAGGGYRDVGNRYLFEEMDAPLQDGMLLLFPSYLRHSGLPYQGDIDRIVLAFNVRVFLKGEPSNLRP